MDEQVFNLGIKENRLTKKNRQQLHCMSELNKVSVIIIRSIDLMQKWLTM